MALGTRLISKKIWSLIESRYHQIVPPAASGLQKHCKERGKSYKCFEGKDSIL